MARLARVGGSGVVVCARELDMEVSGVRGWATGDDWRWYKEEASYNDTFSIVDSLSHTYVCK